MNPGTQAERHPQLRAGLVLQAVAGTSVAGKGYGDALKMIRESSRPVTLGFAGGASPRADKPDEIPAQRRRTVAVSFSEEGSLGISWRHRQEDGAAVLKMVREGSYAAKAMSSQAGLQVGLVLLKVNGQSTVGIPFKDAIELIRKAGRPLELELGTDDASESTKGRAREADSSRGFSVREAGQGVVEVTITAVARTGLMLESAGGKVKVAGSQPGSLAAALSAQMPGLCGMRLVSMAPSNMPTQSADELPLAVVVNILDNGRRPLAVALERPRSNASPPSG